MPQWANAVSMDFRGKPKWCLMRETRSSWSEKRIPDGEQMLTAASWPK
jgi:hypothetical protein